MVFSSFLPMFHALGLSISKTHLHTPIFFVCLFLFSDNPGLVPTKTVSYLKDSSVYEGQKRSKRRFSNRVMSSCILPHTPWVIVELIHIKCLKQCLAEVFSARKERGRKRVARNLRELSPVTQITTKSRPISPNYLGGESPCLQAPEHTILPPATRPL